VKTQSALDKTTHIKYKIKSLSPQNIKQSEVGVLSYA